MEYDNGPAPSAYGKNSALDTEKTGPSNFDEKRDTFSKEYREWRKKVLYLNGGKCFKCGSITQLHVHHKKSWRNFPELRYAVFNGQVLCYTCHLKEHPYMVQYYPEKKKEKTGFSRNWLKKLRRRGKLFNPR